MASLLLDAAPPARLLALGPRPVDGIRLLARGLTRREIGGVLGIGEGTVEGQRMRVSELRALPRRREAALRLREVGLDESSV